jgi:hypothetical protein
MEFTLGYLAGSGASWETVLVTLAIIGGILILIKAVTGKDLS